MKLNRRNAMGVTAGAVVAGISNVAGAAPKHGEVSFAHGVASGDPLHDRVILWTRVTPADGAAGSYQVQWEVAAEPEFRRVLRRGTSTTGPAIDFTVKVDAAGLRPNRDYYYRFRCGKTVSPVGRTRTLPVGDVADVVMAVASCSLYSAGFFNAYRDIASLPRVDLVLHLGDYIYEYGGAPDQLGMSIGSTIGRAPKPDHEAVTLADYRERHACYRSDPDLQAAHARAPWICVWDDHETANDAWTGGAQNHQPNEGSWAERKAASVQAFLEWVPIRPAAPGTPRENICRTFELGNLASLIMVENRLVGRDRQVDLRNPEEVKWNVMDLSDPAKPVVVEDPAIRRSVLAANFSGRPVPAPYEVRIDADSLRSAIARPERSVYGRQIEAWLEQQLHQSVSAGKRWLVIGNQVVMGRTKGVNIPAYLGREQWERIFAKVTPLLRPWLKQLETLPADIPFEFDGWDAYPAARARMDAMFANSGGQTLVLSGDSHAFWVNSLVNAAGQRVAAEVGTSAITSSSLGNMLGNQELGPLFMQSCPEVRFNQHLTKGYSLVTLTADHVDVELVGVSTVLDKRYERFTLKSFRLPAGKPGALPDWQDL